jgi:outer membrane protein TolC
MDTKFKFLIFLFFLMIISFSSHGQEHLELFYNSSPSYKALDIQQVALKNEIEARDLVVSTQLNLNANFARDARQLPPLVLRQKDKSEVLSAGLSKYLGTGTTLSFTSGVETYDYRGISSPEINAAFSQISLSQNLWKDAFGRGDSIRRSINNKELELRSTQLSREKALLITQFEEAFWNYVAALTELNLRKESLKRWQDSEKWMQDRYNRSAAEFVDLKQVSATRILREIQVQNLEQAILNYKNQIDQITEPGFADRLIINDSHLKNNDFSISKATDVQSLDSLINSYSADLIKENTKQQVEIYRPDLKFNLVAGRTGIGNYPNEAWGDSYNANGDYFSVGLSLSAPIEFSLLKQNRKSAELAQQAADLKKKQAYSAGVLAWSSLQQQISLVHRRLKLLENLSEEQRKRNVSERHRFMNGRSSSLQLVFAEQDSLDAEVTLRTTTAELRKLISKYRLYDLDLNKEIQ